jgi:nuclease S1
MRRSIAVLLLLVPSSLYAWGRLGHAVVADIAQQNLSDTAGAEVDRLLGGKSMASISSVPDQIRNKRPETGPWHFTDIPVTREYDAAEDCVDTNCVVDQVKAAQKTLGDRSKSDADRKDALIFLTHLVGDLHQPLHCAMRLKSGKSDRGGNLVKVRVNGNQDNLHHVWDATLLEQEELNQSDYVDFLTGDFIGDRDPETLMTGTVEDWAGQSHTLAQESAYKPIKNSSKVVTISAKYLDDNTKVVDDQLLKGGLRLARLINEALGGS